MFDITTILSLIAPALIAPLAGLVFVRAIVRAEAAGQADRRAAPTPRIVLDPAPAPLSAERERAAKRHAA